MARSSLTALFTLLLVASASAQEWSAAQQEVWEMEEAYWERRQRADVEGFMDLWDEDFVGWPYWAAEPMTKADIRQYAYELQGRDAAGREANRTGRLTHTWRSHAGKWRIIGGMSSPHSG
jgi:ketosteroid isomerase-like protein